METIIRALHASCAASGRKMVVAVTGGGLSGASLLLSVPGASQTVLEVTCPYSRLSFSDYISPAPLPHSLASEAAALSLGRASLARARSLCLRDRDVIGASLAVGLGASAALVSSAPRAGTHRCHVALCSHEKEEVWSVVLEKGSRERNEEEVVCGHLVVGAAASSVGLLPNDGGGGPISGMKMHMREKLKEGDQLTFASLIIPPPLERLLMPSEGGVGEALSHVFFPPFSPACPLPNVPLSFLTTSKQEGRVIPKLVILSGSFNPLHRGHKALGAAAVAALSRVYPPEHPPPLLIYELSALNVDKPPLSVTEVTRRLAPFLEGGETPQIDTPWHGGVVVTKCPTFMQKAALLPGAAFAVGWDTAARIVSPRYYEGGKEGMLRALAELVRSGTVVLVGGRRAGAAPLPPDWEGHHPDSPLEFLTLEKHILPFVPAILHPLFLGISEDKFREDISSTALRGV
jgi:hypothetical protein